MSQPEWELVTNLGDVNPLDYGGYFVFRDTTGVYPEEGELLIVDHGSENSTYTVYRFILDRCTWINSVLSDNKFHPDHAAWFADSLGEIASHSGMEEQVLRMQLCSGCSVERANAYRAVGEYHGFDNLDSYPLTLTRDEAEKRYANCV